MPSSFSHVLSLAMEWSFALGPSRSTCQSLLLSENCSLRLERMPYVEITIDPCFTSPSGGQNKSPGLESLQQIVRARIRTESTTRYKGLTWGIHKVKQYLARRKN